MSKWLHKCQIKGCRHEDEWCDRRRDQCDCLVRGLPDEPVRTCGEPTTWLSQPNSGMYPLAYCDEHMGQVSTQELADLREQLRLTNIDWANAMAKAGEAVDEIDRLRALIEAWCDAEDSPHGEEATQRWLETHAALRGAIGR